MRERGAGLVLRAVAGWVFGFCLAGGAALRAEDGPSLPGAFPPLGLAGDATAGGPADYLSFLRSLGASEPSPTSDLVLPRLLFDPRDLAQAALPQTPALPDPHPWQGWQTDPFAPSKVSTSSQGVWGTLTGNVTVTGDGTAGGQQPLVKRTWQADQSWRRDVAGPLSAFGQVGGNSDEACQSDMQVNARTGLACKLPVPGLSEFVLRGGPGVSYTDPLHPDRTLSHSDWMFEVQARCPLIFGAGLEYQASALPALAAQAQDQLNQDLRLAVPVGSTGKFKVGARHQWASTPNTRPSTDSMQLYLGLELAH
jgi:hypothetical protein